ncbi:MAG: response regulator, partial [Nitrospirae bacterium]|nr:response regulator [Nitrospirota bacterium]
MTRVLIVEDEIIIAEDIKDALLKLGYEVPAVLHSGEEAIRASEELRPDIVLMDIILKGVVDGFTAAEQITGLFGIPLIFLTAHADAKTFERAKVTNPYGYLLKPFDIHALQHAIEISLYKH